jgi:preprotein translocase subunit SecE
VWKIYKEGQGKWARVLVVTGVALGAVYGVVSLHESLPSYGQFPLPVLNWSFDYRFLIEGPILIAALAFAVWLFNHPPAADFLIDTETELRKVTWPSRKEEINNSIVVVVTVVIIGAFVLSWDLALSWIQKIVYDQDHLMQ